MTARTRFAAVAAIVLLPLAATAQDGMFEGDWAAGDPMACDVSGNDSINLALRIRGDVFRGLETECRMTNPVTVRDLGAMLYDMDCTGEGDRWSYRALLMIDRDGQLVLISDGSALIYPRCQAYAEPQTERTGTPALPRK